MYFIAIVAIVNVMLGFALAVYLGGHHRKLPVFKQISAFFDKILPRKLHRRAATFPPIPGPASTKENENPAND